MKTLKGNRVFLTLFHLMCADGLSYGMDLGNDEKITPKIVDPQLSMALPDPKMIFAQCPRYQRNAMGAGFQQLPYEDQIFLRDKATVTKIIWKGPESILPYVQEGPNYDVVEVHMDFEKDELTNELFDAVLNLAPKVLTILNNSKGVSQDFRTTTLMEHINFQTLEELNFGYCYKLQPFVQDVDVARKIRRLTWGALSPETIQDAVPDELADLADIRELNLGGVLLGEGTSVVLDRLKNVFANKSDLEIFAADFMWIDLYQWLNLMPPSMSLKIMDVSGVYAPKVIDNVEEKYAAETEIFTHLKQQDNLTTLKLIHYRSDDWQNFGSALVNCLSLTTHLKHLYLVGLSLTSEQWKILGIGLGNYRHLQTLVLTQSNVDSEAVPFISTCLINNRYLTRVSLGDNKQLIPLDGLLLLMSISSRQLAHIDINHCLDIQRAKSYLMQLIGEQHELESLSILSNQVEVNDIIDLVKARSCSSCPLKIYVGGGSNQQDSQPLKILLSALLEKIRNEPSLFSGSSVSIHLMPYDLTAQQNYLLFSNKTRDRITVCGNPLQPLVPINVDNMKAKWEHLANTSSFQDQKGSSSVADPLSSSYAWYNPLAYAYNPLNLLWRR